MHLNPFTAAHPAGPLAPAHANPLLGAGAFAPAALVPGGASPLLGAGAPHPFAPRAFGAPAYGDLSARIAQQVFGGRGGSVLLPTGITPGTYTSVTVDAFGRVVAGSTASAPLDITGLTATDPADADELPVYDASASANRKVTIQRVLGLCAATPGGRITDSSSDPWFSGSGGSTIYYLPVYHGRLPLWDGTRWLNVSYSDSGISLALSGLTASRPYDVFVYSSSGTATLEILAWTSDTARATGISIQDGRFCKTGDKTRLYLGTIYTSATNAITRSITQEPVWNMYHRGRREMWAYKTSGTHTYATDTWRSLNADNAYRCQFVRGLSAEAVSADARFNTTGSSAAGLVGVGLDRTNGNDAQTLVEVSHGSDLQVVGNTHARYVGRPAIGYHYLQLVEKVRAGTITFRADFTPGVGMTVEVWA